jgi:hypothetical protein
LLLFFIDKDIRIDEGVSAFVKVDVRIMGLYEVAEYFELTNILIT